jgi:excisionase family DNA binding protein
MAMSQLKTTPPSDAAIAAHTRPLPDILKVAEVASLLRVNRKTLYEAVQRDEIPGAFRVGRCLRFHRDAVLMWLGQGRLVPDSQGNTR